MARVHGLVCALLAGAVGDALAAPVINGDFQSGAFSPWTVSATPAGGSFGQSVGTFDIDGPGALPASLAAQFIVGQTVGGTGAQGMALTQPVALSANVEYDLRFRWAVRALVNAHNASGGIFELLIDGVQLAVTTAPVTVAGQNSYGALAAAFRPSESRVYQLSVRITRTVPLGEEVFQFVDNVAATLSCPGDANGDGIVSAQDLALLLGAWETSLSSADLDGDGIVASGDLARLLGAWGACA